VLADDNEVLRTLALDLVRGSVRLGGADYRKGDARDLVTAAEPADLVIASYMIGELTDAARPELIDALWARTGDTLLVIEPGTPAGYQRIIAARDRLIATGAHIAAPCPHAAPCPLMAPDWCHFAQRLARSRAHRQIKGADVPFEDEKFSFVALTRQQAAHRPAARVLAPPLVTKVAAAAKLCQSDGTARIVSTSRRDKPAFAAARRWDWGDGVETPPHP
jgi:ribosomal protein RSM22 (predicted rRNA methylase)